MRILVVLCGISRTGSLSEAATLLEPLTVPLLCFVVHYRKVLREDPHLMCTTKKKHNRVPTVPCAAATGWTRLEIRLLLVASYSSLRRILMSDAHKPLLNSNVQSIDFIKLESNRLSISPALRWWAAW